MDSLFNFFYSIGIQIYKNFYDRIGKYEILDVLFIFVPLHDRNFAIFVAF